MGGGGEGGVQGGGGSNTSVMNNLFRVLSCLDRKSAIVRSHSEAWSSETIVGGNTVRVIVGREGR